MIPLFRENAMTIPQIAAMYGCSQREVKAEIERLRAGGVFVVARRGKGGVYITEDKDEALEAIRRYGKQTFRMVRLFNGLKAAWKQKHGQPGQEVFDFE